MHPVRAAETSKYNAAWAIDDYLHTSPGEVYSGMFGDIAKPKAGQTVIDLGCGVGAGGKALADKYNLVVTFLDLVNVRKGPTLVQPLWQPIGGSYDYGYCCDVMEHVPPEFSMLVAANILASCKRAFFSISFLPDYFGRVVGEPLHMNVQPFAWWRDRLGEIGEVIDARDLIGEGVFYVAKGEERPKAPSDKEIYYTDSPCEKCGSIIYLKDKNDSGYSSVECKDCGDRPNARRPNA